MQEREGARDGCGAWALRRACARVATQGHGKHTFPVVAFR